MTPRSKDLRNTLARLENCFKNSNISLAAKNGQKLYNPHSQFVKAARNKLQKNNL